MLNQILIGTGAIAGIIGGSYINSLFDFTEEAYIKLRSNEREFEPIIKDPKEKYGLILIDNPRKNHLKEFFNNTLNLVYKTLKERGYKDENIYILEGKNKPTIKCPCQLFPASKRCLEEVLVHLEKKITFEDTFFMNATTHGQTTGLILPIGQSTLSLEKDIITEKELEHLLSNLNPNYSVIYFNGCHSGGFAKRLGKGRRIAISTCRKTKVTGPVDIEIEKKYGKYLSSFTLFFYSALRNQLPNGESLPFKNINIEEAFKYAALKQQSTTDFKIKGFGKITPHLIYEAINPNEISL